MFYTSEYPKLFTTRDPGLRILSNPIRWFQPFQSGLGQILLYRLKIQPIEQQVAKNLMMTTVLTMENGTKIRVGYIKPSPKPKAVVLYLHTVCGDYIQFAHIGGVFYADNVAYVSYTRAGNDMKMAFSSFNFIGDIKELQLVIQFIQKTFVGVDIHAIGASAGSALLIRYLGKFNTSKAIKSAVLVSPGYHFIRSFESMSGFSKAYLINKLKYTVRRIYKEQVDHIRTFDDWIEFQSKMLGYKTKEDYIRESDPVYYLDKINVPALFLSSLDDGIFNGDITQEFLELPRSNPNVSIVVTKQGGHAMFEDEGHDIPWFLRVCREWVHNKSAS